MVILDVGKNIFRKILSKPFKIIVKLNLTIWLSNKGPKLKLVIKLSKMIQRLIQKTSLL